MAGFKKGSIDFSNRSEHLAQGDVYTDHINLYAKDGRLYTIDESGTLSLVAISGDIDPSLYTSFSYVNAISGDLRAQIDSIPILEAGDAISIINDKISIDVDDTTFAVGANEYHYNGPLVDGLGLCDSSKVVFNGASITMQPSSNVFHNAPVWKLGQTTEITFTLTYSASINTRIMFSKIDPTPFVGTTYNCDTNAFNLFPSICFNPPGTYFYGYGSANGGVSTGATTSGTQFKFTIDKFGACRYYRNGVLAYSVMLTTDDHFLMLYTGVGVPTYNNINIKIDEFANLSLKETGVTGGTYANPSNLVVDSKGRITSISNNTEVVTNSLISAISGDLRAKIEAIDLTHFANVLAISGDLHSKINNIESNYSTISYVNGISGNLQGQLTNNDNDISTLQSQVTSISANFDNYATNTYVLAISGNLQTKIDNIEQESTAISGDNTLVIGQTGSNFSLSVADYISATEVYAISGNLQSKINSIDITPFALNSNVLAISGELQALDANFDNYASNAYVLSISGDLQSQINNLQSLINNLPTSLDNTFATDIDVDAVDEQQMLSLIGNCPISDFVVGISGTNITYRNYNGITNHTKNVTNNVEGYPSTVIESWEYSNFNYVQTKLLTYDEFGGISSTIDLIKT